MMRFLLSAWRTLIFPVLRALVMGPARVAPDAQGVPRSITYFRDQSVSKPQFRRVQSRVCPSGRLVAMLFAAICLLLIVACLVMATGLSYALVFLIVIVIATTQLSQLGWSVHLSAKPERVRDAWLTESLCPSCTHALLIQPEAAGSSTPARCTECGASWIIPPPPPRATPSCSFCGYSLVGLPESSACPECGKSQMSAESISKASITRTCPPNAVARGLARR